MNIIRAIMLILLILAVPSPAQSGQVERVIDGDTIIVDGVRVRIWGVDAPERGQPYSRQATMFTRRQALGQDVTLIDHGRDRYGRTVAEVILPDGRDLGQDLTRQGLARWKPKYARRAFHLKNSQTRAQAQRRGQWRKTP